MVIFTAVSSVKYLTNHEKDTLRKLIKRREEYFGFLGDAEKRGQNKRMRMIYNKIHDYSLRINRWKIKDLKRSLETKGRSGCATYPLP